MATVSHEKEAKEGLKQRRKTVVEILAELEAAKITAHKKERRLEFLKRRIIYMRACGTPRKIAQLAETADDVKRGETEIEKIEIEIEMLKIDLREAREQLSSYRRNVQKFLCPP